MSFSLRQMQAEQRAWVAHNFPDSVPHQPLLGAMEELGELAHAHLKAEQGIRGDAAEHHLNKVDAIGDIVIYLADYCTKAGIDLEAAIEVTWAKVRKRDWQANRLNGGELPPEACVHGDCHNGRPCQGACDHRDCL